MNRKLTLITIVLIPMGLSCGNMSRDQLISGSFLDAPELFHAYPPEGAQNVAVNTSILFTSSQKLDPSSFHRGIILQGTGEPESFSVTVLSDTLYEVIPDHTLAGNVQYTFSLNSNLRSLRGKAPQKGISITFHTIDNEAPVIENHTIADLDEGVDQVTFTFSFNKPVSGVELASESVSVVAEAGCLDCLVVSELTGQNAGPYSISISGFTPFSSYSVNFGTNIKNSSGVAIVPTSIKFNAKPRLVDAKNVGSRGVFTSSWSVHDFASLTATDPSGNLYIAGHFTGTSNFGGTPTTASNFDIFVVKYDSEHNFVWQKIINTTSLANEMVLNIIATDSGIYIGGRMAGQLTLPLEPSGSVSLGHVPVGTDGYIIKLNPETGGALWASRIASTNGDSNDSIFLYTNYDGYLVMSVNVNGLLSGAYILEGALGNCSTALVHNTTAINTLTARFLVAVREDTGACQWAVSTHNNYSINEAIAHAGMLYVTGGYSASGSFCCSLSSLTHTGNGDAFLLRLTLNGANIPNNSNGYARSFGQAATAESFKYMAIDSVNNELLLQGTTNGATNLNCSGTSCNGIGAAGRSDVIMMAADLNTGSAKRAYSYGGAYDDFAGGILLQNGKIRMMVDHDTTFSNTAINLRNGCSSLRGFGARDFLMLTVSEVGEILGARFLGTPYDEKSDGHGRMISLTNQGRLFGAMNMTEGKIGSFSVGNLPLQPAIVFWAME